MYNECSCSSSSNGLEGEELPYYEELLIGKWTLQSQDIEGDEMLATIYPTPLWIKMDNKGKVKYEHKGETINGVYIAANPYELGFALSIHPEDETIEGIEDVYKYYTFGVEELNENTMV